ncbi:apolipoprotein N-acyltransferase [Pseudogulbenkiania sp. MAI-1]|uniref:apolipoprotein N-acyltransferase n=1 Tax=Pseudogulbenkiania sp. MAI-1 TaxID=990370 RepID=UPI00045EAC71|nr:apolipoprotein N-acyltransferase [Pseudogulbenkiania sp. MAI-1]
MRTFLFLLLAALAGTATLFAFAPYRLFWLMPLALAALAELAQRQPHRAFWLGYAWGIAAYTANFHWIYNSLHDIAGMPFWLAAPMTALLPAYLALYPGLALWLSTRIDRRPAMRWLVLFPALWTLGEWLRGWMLTGFPWGAAGYSQITESPLAGYAAVSGIYGVTLLVAVSAGSLVVLPRLANRWRVLLLAALAALWAGGEQLKAIPWTEPAGKPVRVALAQGNIPQSLKWEPTLYEYTLASYYRQVATTRADLMILPETALPAFLDELPPGFVGLLAATAERNRMALAFGVPRRTDDGRGYLNAVIAPTTPGQPFYAKDHLVPFGEFIPLPGVTSWIYRFMNMPLSGFSRGGANQAPIAMAGQQVAFNVCYEDSFGEELIGPAARATLLANVSNLAWFGQSDAASQHLQLSQARALETGRPMLRSTNTGMTAIIRADGEIAAVAAPFTRQVLSGMVQGRQGLTPYMQYGNRPVLLLSAMLLGLAALLGRRHRPQRA